ncbi:F-box/kelch-repeat protein [Thalictrum thalictroides]|uniref:F-box/kelch-repeat protein n=1 Tax=Thalictrum thalictroides TaxID=46969 RepID=A0A7J6XA46_THATH|nr:F-box/kelch-repeat protein [Thalictrum thalictroides]
MVKNRRITRSRMLSSTSFQEELIMEILSWVPIKSLIRFRGVSFTIFGFGFHHATQEYKIIRLLYTPKVLQSPGVSGSHVSVYTFGTRSWRSLESTLDTYGINDISNESAPVLVNGALHFLAATPVSTIYDAILSFDVKNEVFQVISPPNGPVSYNIFKDVRLGEFGGLLYMSFTLKDVGIDIWIMQEYGVVESWTNQFKINLPSFKSSLKLLGVADNGETVLEKDDTEYYGGLNIEKCTSLVLYNLKTNSRRRLKKPRFKYDHACEFVGSLVSPRLINEVRSTTDTGKS